MAVSKYQDYIFNSVCVDFLRFSLETRYGCPEVIKKVDWAEITNWAQKQTIVGVLYEGLQRIGPYIRARKECDKGVGDIIPFEILVEWLALVCQIERRNRLVNKKCVELTAKLNNDGFECCILKGQGNAMLYPNPFSRTSGDIDVWVKPKDENNQDRVNKVIAYAKNKNTQGLADIIHVDYGDFGGVEVELHYWPTSMNSPIHNKRFRQWVRLQEKSVFNNKIKLPDGEGFLNVPTTEFNIVYQLSHMYKHVISEGIGLRQMIDYYYLLKSDDGIKESNIVYTLKYLGLYKFAGAVMYVLHQALGMGEEKLIVPMDERRGKFLLEVILKGGNFGKYDTRGYLVKWNNPMGSFLRHAEHDLRLIRYFPSESLWEPVSRVYQYFWRKWYN